MIYGNVITSSTSRPQLPGTSDSVLILFDRPQEAIVMLLDVPQALGSDVNSRASCLQVVHEVSRGRETWSFTSH